MRADFVFSYWIFIWFFFILYASRPFLSKVRLNIGTYRKYWNVHIDAYIWNLYANHCLFSHYQFFDKNCTSVLSQRRKGFKKRCCRNLFVVFIIHCMASFE